MRASAILVAGLILLTGCSESDNVDLAQVEVLDCKKLP